MLSPSGNIQAEAAGTGGSGSSSGYTVSRAHSGETGGLSASAAQGSGHMIRGGVFRLHSGIPRVGRIDHLQNTLPHHLESPASAKIEAPFSHYGTGQDAGSNILEASFTSDCIRSFGGIAPLQSW